ncbi:MAG: hypothetical protein HY898_23465 [Deltaproteobacteria bacterium]|nr:hypothetical protein [Deltaproteobacteria bacterium]
MPEPRVKGVAFRTVDQCFLELRGAEAQKRARALMPPELADNYQRGLVLASSWYPISWYRQVFAAFLKATGDGPELARQIGYRSMQLDMKSVYKQVFARFVSPQTMLTMSNRLFNSYYDTARATVIDPSHGHVRMLLTQCIGWDLNMFTEIQGSATALLEIAGAKQVRQQLLSGGRDGDTEMELEAHWI